MKVVVFFGVMVFQLMVVTGHAQDPQNMKVENQNLDCARMKSTFSSISDAHSELENRVFAFSQELKTTKLSGVKSVNYFSCDNELGFLLIKIDQKEYLYKDYPRFQWKLLIESNDLEMYYEENIKGKYVLIVSGSS